MTSVTFDVYVLATPWQVRSALADPGLVPAWVAGLRIQPDGEDDVDEASPRLTCEWLQTGLLDANGGSPSVVRFEFVAMGQATRLRVVHRNLAPDGSYLQVVAAGWPMILSSLKSLIETGRRLEFRRTA
jgi:Activator of Hsp90 ATPase homolog 1-like protein